MDTLTTIIHTYQNIIRESELQLQHARKQIRNISLLRLIIFIGGIAAVTLSWDKGGAIICLSAVIPLILFAWLVKKHNYWFYQKEFLKKKIEINHQELEGINYNFSNFDGGQEYVDPSHLYTFDLDVFGEHSLFQSLNRTSTPIGKSRLANWFNEHLKQQQEIEQRQAAIRELTPELEFRQLFRLHGLLYKGNPTDEKEIANWVASPSRYRKHRLLRLLPFIVGSCNMLCIILAIAGVISADIACGVFVIFVISSFIFSKGVTQIQETYGKKLQILSIYADQILLTEKKEMHSPALKTQKAVLTSNNQPASKVVRQLAKLMNALDQRNNIAISIIRNGFMFWELWQVMRIEAWKEENGTDLPKWLLAVGEIDAYCSLATFAYNHPNYTYPQLTSTPFSLQAKELGHPLMERDKCVQNDINMEKRPFFIIITGANMAGKSTYLRTIGINYLLACIGSPVWASEMKLYPASLVTSLRTSDSLTDNESYFFAELKRLKLIINKLEAGEELFIILDEILKGTNSTDKQKGSLALIKQLLTLHSNGIIATHDLMLGTLAERFPQDIRNHCFEADISKNELTFSYKMKEGVAQNMNACFLMKKMGIAVIDNIDN